MLTEQLRKNISLQIFSILGKNKGRSHDGVYITKKMIFHFGDVLFLEFVSLDNSCLLFYINTGLNTSGSHIYLNLYILRY